MNNKYLLFDLDDEKSKKLGEILGNETCKKIINLLAEKELGASELAKELDIPINTTTYNLEKLTKSGLIEESKSFWSVKGRKMPTYKLVNKAIVISPKKGNIYSKIKGVLPVIISAVIFSIFILKDSLKNIIFSNTNTIARDTLKTSAQVGAANSATEAMNTVQSSGISSTSLFLIAIWLVIALFVAWSIYTKK